MVYVYLIAANVLLGFMTDLCLKYNKKFFGLLFLLAILLIDTIVIGLRDLTVGIDTGTYIEWYFDQATDIESWTEFFGPDMRGDRGFMLLGWIAGLISDFPQVFLIIIEFFIMFWMLLGLYEYKKSIDFSIGWYMLLFWVVLGQETFNLMRQFCAMALLFYGFSQFIQGRYKTYAVLQIIAFFFHSTSPLFMIVPAFYYFSDKGDRLRNLFATSVFGGIIFIITSYSLFLQFAGDLGIVNETYVDRYGQGSEYEYEGGFISLRYILRFLLPTLLVLLARRKEIMSKEMTYMLVGLFFTGALLEQTRFVMVFFFRLAYYVQIVSFIYLSKLYQYKRSLTPLLLLYLLLMIVYAMGNYTWTASNDNTFVYSSIILGL